MKRTAQPADDPLADATLPELQARFPQEWITVGEALVAATRTQRPEAVAAFMQRFHRPAETARQSRPARGKGRARQSGAAPGPAALSRLAMARMAHLAAEQVLRATAARVANGGKETALRFGWWSGFLVQRLLFARGLERKPVSVGAFRWWWPLVRQRRILMPLVSPRGIYCFYARELIWALGERIGERSCVELAAGDGTLSRFLNAAGTAVRATDDRSWSHVIGYPDDVETLDAAAALERHRPAVVLCSFPPPKNTFERAIFRTPSVELYVVITTRHRFAAGDWQAYEEQTGFEVSDDKRLSRLVLPPEIDPAVLIFTRR